MEFLRLENVRARLSGFEWVAVGANVLLLLGSSDVSAVSASRFTVPRQTCVPSDQVLRNSNPPFGCSWPAS